MRRLRDFGNEAGTSLVELLIGLGILAIIGSFSANFFTRLTKSDVEVTARSNAISQINGLANTIERDLKFRKLSDDGSALAPLCANGNDLCPTLSYNRLAKTTAGDDEKDYKVTIENKCVDIPETIAKHFKGKTKAIDFSAAGINAITAQINGGEVAKSAGACLAKIACAKGKYPQVRFKRENTAGLVVPIYPADLPILAANKGFTQGVVAAAVCVKSSGNADQVVVESVVINSEDLPRIDRKELGVPRANIANIQMLPLPKKTSP